MYRFENKMIVSLTVTPPTATDSETNSETNPETSMPCTCHQSDTILREMTAEAYHSIKKVPFIQSTDGLTWSYQTWPGLISTPTQDGAPSLAWALAKACQIALQQGNNELDDVEGELAKIPSSLAEEGKTCFYNDISLEGSSEDFEINLLFYVKDTRNDSLSNQRRSRTHGQTKYKKLLHEPESEVFSVPFEETAAAEQSPDYQFFAFEYIRKNGNQSFDWDVLKNEVDRHLPVPDDSTPLGCMGRLLSTLAHCTSPLIIHHSGSTLPDQTIPSAFHVVSSGRRPAPDTSFLIPNYDGK